MEERRFSNGEEQLALPERVLLISPTPVILAFFAERKKGTRKEVTMIVFQVARRLEESRVHINAVFRGSLSEPRGAIQSETVDEDIWYWLSNQFLRECPDPDEDDLCLEVNKPLDDYRLDRMADNLKEIRWPSEDDRQCFLRVLKEVFSLAPAE